MSWRPSTLTAAPLAISLVCAGCFQSRAVDIGDAATDAGRSVDPAVVRAAREALDRVAAERCRHAIDCAPLYFETAGFFEDWLCHPENRDRATVAAIERGDAVLDAEALAECLAFLDSFEGCFEPSPPFSVPIDDPCRSVVRGTTPVGGACGIDGWWGCDESGSCDECAFVCVRASLAGERCGDGARCLEDLRCVDGLCEPLDRERSREIGEACSWDDECPVGALCADHVCRLPPAATELDAPCFDRRWCSEGQWCSYPWGSADGSCEALRPEGGRCPDERACASGLVCASSTCQAARGLGEPCDESADCGPDAPYCVARRLAAGTCQADAVGLGCQPAHATLLYASPTGCPEGYGCVARDGDWFFGECRRVIALGAACTDPAECPPSARCDAGTCRAISDPGDPCDAERICPRSFACSAGTCVPRPVVGEPCGDALPCLRGLCRDGTCALLAIGEPCTDTHLCRGSWCSGGVCTPFRVAGPGEPCAPADGVTCGAGTWCDGTGVCAGPCTGP